ncbi:hypothetical protein CAMRE0001_0501 [Campylobacter rectus RM3267]|uniref:Uncharacterized protein n=1 Tax=Campylobacter rectus RM3267 TaxID=553218 RepID=B9D2X8_CAMRE|nr:hypothetical protein CAMRE0001_0501 [Campylobacter rectus RM3267]
MRAKFKPKICKITADKFAFGNVNKAGRLNFKNLQAVKIWQKIYQSRPHRNEVNLCELKASRKSSKFKKN